MFKRRDFLLALIGGLSFGQRAFAFSGKWLPRYTGSKITRVVVKKRERKLYLLAGDAVIRSFPISLGFTPYGHKQREGDGKTPEGWYHIDRRNPNSSFFLSLGISYPNAQDRLRAKRAGQKPGGDIFIHGQPNKRFLFWRAYDYDWTEGCIAVSNRDMRWIYAMVEVETPISIEV